MTLEDAEGRELARATTPALAGVKNFQVSSAPVKLAYRAASAQRLKVRVTAASGEREITLLNNAVALPLRANFPSRVRAVSARRSRPPRCRLRIAL